MARFSHRRTPASDDSTIGFAFPAPTVVAEKRWSMGRGSLLAGAPSNRQLTHHRSDGHGANETANKRKSILELTQTTAKHAFTIRAEGESGRSGFHIKTFVKVLFGTASPAAKLVNLLWPIVPVAITVRYVLPDHYMLIFILSYIAMVPCANMIGCAGQELARKVPHVFGVLTETTLGSVVEIIVLIIMLTRPERPGVDYYEVVKSAIMGSILATMLLCLGLCFIMGGLRREEQVFSEAVSEAGSGLLLVAGFGLVIPTVFEQALDGAVTDSADLFVRTMTISRSTAVLLMIAYFIFVFFQTRSHHGIFDAVFEADALRDREQRASPRLTFVECAVALMVTITLVAFIAIALVDQIHPIVEERHVSDAFMGLILVPLVEKAAEHLTAIDEAWDNQMNFALSQVLGATLQTALFNGPLVVIVGWGLGKPMGLNFEVFDITVLLLAIITVGIFLRDQKSNYLEGSLCVIVYVAIAVAAYSYPEIRQTGAEGSSIALNSKLHLAAEQVVHAVHAVGGGGA